MDFILNNCSCGIWVKMSSHSFVILGGGGIYYRRRATVPLGADRGDGRWAFDQIIEGHYGNPKLIWLNHENCGIGTFNKFAPLAYYFLILHRNQQGYSPSQPHLDGVFRFKRKISPDIFHSRQAKSSSEQSFASWWRLMRPWVCVRFQSYGHKFGRGGRFWCGSGTWRTCRGWPGRRAPPACTVWFCLHPFPIGGAGVTAPRRRRSASRCETGACRQPQPVRWGWWSSPLLGRTWFIRQIGPESECLTHSNGV